MGIEPTLEAWEAAVLPLNHTRFGIDQTYYNDLLHAFTARRTEAKIQIWILN